MKIILCEDELSQQHWMEAALMEWQKASGTAVDLIIYGSGEELFFKQEEWADADVIILDVELKKMNGIKIAKAIRRIDEKVPLFFATGYEKYVFEGYEVGAISYIMKPIDKRKLFDALDKAKAMSGEAEKCLLLEEGEGSKRIYIRDIAFVESDGHYCVIHSKVGAIHVREKISHLQVRLEGQNFFMCHRSYLVNMAYVSRITKKDITMDSGETIPLARGKWEEVNKAFINYYGK